MMRFPKIKSELTISTLPIILIFLLTLVFFYPVIFQNKTFFAFDTLSAYLPWSETTPVDKPNNLLITDPVNLNYPFYRYFKRAVNQFTFPLWFSTSFSGIPVSAGSVSTLSYPVLFAAHLVFPVSIAHDFTIWLHLLGAGIFLFLYLRVIHLQTISALFGAVAWMFNGYVMVWFEFEIIIILALSLPAILYFFERWLQDKKLLDCLCIAGAVGCSIGSGFPHIIIFQSLLIMAYMIFRYTQLYLRDKAFRLFSTSDFKQICLTSVLIALISSAFFISHLSQLNDSQREAFSFNELYKKTGELHTRQLATLIYPDLFGNPTRHISFIPKAGGLQPYNNHNEMCIYAGIMTLFLVVACIPYSLNKPFIFFFMTSALLSLTMAMGSILYLPLWKLIPGLNLSVPARILYIFGFSMSVLAAMGADILLSDERKKRSFIFIYFLILAATAIYISLIVPVDSLAAWLIKGTHYNQAQTVVTNYLKRFPDVLLRPLLVCFASFILLSITLFTKKSRLKTAMLLVGLGLLSFDLMTYGFNYNTVSARSSAFPTTESIAFLKNHAKNSRIATYGNFMHNTLVPFNISEIGGYSPFYPQRYGEYLHLSQNGPNAQAPENFSRWTVLNSFGSPLIDLINTKYLLVPNNASLVHKQLELAFDGEIKIYKNKGAFPRVFFVNSFQHAKDRQEAYHRLKSYSGTDFRNKVILESFPPKEFMDLSHNNGDTSNSKKVNIVTRGPNSLTIEVKTDSKGFVVISEGYHQAWEARIGDEPSEVLRANYIMRAIPVNKGHHQISLTFSPKQIIAGLIATATGWILLLILITIQTLKNRAGRIHSIS